jgi:hypothetical protein
MRFYNFLVYDPITHKLKYSKFNFDFNKYYNDNQNLINDKNLLFDNFWTENNYDFLKPFTVYPKHEKYFTPITIDIQSYVSKYGLIHGNFMAETSTNIAKDILLKYQFELINYDESEYRRLQDFVYANNLTYSYTKYNFDFDTYSSDFNIFDTKLATFTDFIIRNYNTSGVISNFGGNGINNILKKYFKINVNLEEYLFSNSVNSILKYADKNYYNIDFDAYIADNGDLNHLSIDDAKEHYLRWGQFELREMKFINRAKTSLELTRLATCSVFLKNKTDSPITVGFLYYFPNDINTYLVTVHHLIEKFKDQRYVYGIFEHNSKSIMAQFKIIGYDIVTDILVAIYDHTLSYNIINNVDISVFPQLFVNFNYNTLISEKISMIGNLGFDDNLSYIDGRIINTRYSGGFTLDHSTDVIPESILIQSLGIGGVSGSPVLKGNPLDSSIMECIGMVIGGLKSSDQLVIAIDGYLLANIVNKIIDNWDIYIIKQNITNQSYIDKFVKNGYPKTWLGITNQYNHPSASVIYKELSNLSYIGGLLITNFIIGFNVRDETFVFSANDLTDSNVIKFTGPLLNSNIYERFITNGNIPIVIVSISFFDSVKSSFIKTYIGKFGNQDSYSDFVYGSKSIATYSLPGDYYNKFKYEYAPITIEYYYYNGEVWLFDTDVIGGNELSNYITYHDNAGNKYYQHLFEFPQILVPYINNYSISKYAKEPHSRNVNDHTNDHIVKHGSVQASRSINNHSSVQASRSINNHGSVQA